MMMDNDSPKALGFLQSYLQGEGKYKQQGDIPDVELETQYAQEFGGPLVQETMISGSPLQAANQGPSTPVKYDESMGGFVPNPGAGRPANVRYKGTTFGV